jgi:hypothetical protein
MGEERASGRFPAVVLPPGTTSLELRTSEPLFNAPGDPRALGVAVLRLHLAPQRELP